MNSSAFLKMELHQPDKIPVEVLAEQPASAPQLSKSWAQAHGQAHLRSGVVQILDEVSRALERSPEDAHALALRLVALFMPPAEMPSGRARGGLAPWQKRKVDQYLSEHLGRALYVRELAGQVSLSVTHFSRAFRESFGTTPHQHIMGLRLKLAQQLMLTTRDPLSQIALACGMADQSHLTKLFRRALGETPTTWLRRSLTDVKAAARSRHTQASRFVNFGS
jgi:AraC family transcriptional regulator